MSLFIQRFDDGKLCTLAKEIGATDHVLTDIKKLFSVKHAAQWIASTGEDEIRKIMIEYSFVKVTNGLYSFCVSSICTFWNNNQFVYDASIGHITAQFVHN